MYLFDVAQYVAPTWPHAKRMEVWIAYCEHVRSIADGIKASKTDRAARLWSKVFGFTMPYANCVHNASIDENLNGWCKTRLQLRTAKKCKKLIEDWSQHHVANRATNRKYHQLFPTIGE